MQEEIKVRAEQIEGLRELISQVIAEEGERLIPRGFLMDVEEIKRSPVGAIIRMESDIKYLKEGQEALQRGLEALRMEFRKDLGNLEKVMDARFEEFEKRLNRTDFWIKFFAGLVSALFVAQLVLTYIK